MSKKGLVVMSSPLISTPPRVIAHRGASGTAPENTLAAIRKALEIGARMIEIDLHTTLDGEIIVMHDSDVSRTTNGRGAISEMNLEDIRGLDAGFWFGEGLRGERVPTLDEVLRTVQDKAELCIEIKNASPSSVLRRVARWSSIDNVVVFDFNHPRVYEAKEEQGVKTLALGISQENINAIDPSTLDAIGAANSKTNSSLVEKAHSLGLAIFVHTVNEVEDMKKLIDLGVDGIITDHPQRCLPLLERSI